MCSTDRLSVMHQSGGALTAEWPLKHSGIKEKRIVLYPVFCFVVVVLYTLLSVSGKSGRLTWVRLQQPQEQRYPVLKVHAGSFRVSAIHQTPTWTTGPLTCSTWSFICLRIHMEIGHTNGESAQHFGLGHTLTNCVSKVCIQYFKAISHTISRQSQAMTSNSFENNNDVTDAVQFRKMPDDDYVGRDQCCPLSPVELSCIVGCVAC